MRFLGYDTSLESLWNVKSLIGHMRDSEQVSRSYPKVKLTKIMRMTY